MTTPRIRWDGFARDAGPVQVTGSALHHLHRVIKAAVGDHVELLDPSGTLASGIVADLQEGRVIVDIQKVSQAPPVSFRLTMIASPLKRKNTPCLAAKWAELGVYRIVFVPMTRSVASLREQKMNHLDEVVFEACRAVGQQQIPLIELRPRLEDVLQEPQLPPLLHLDEEALFPLSEWTPPSPSEACCVLGPEGGMSPAEKNLLCRMGSQGVRLLGPAIKAETAGVVGAGLILSRAGVL